MELLRSAIPDLRTSFPVGHGQRGGRSDTAQSFATVAAAIRQEIQHAEPTLPADDPLSAIASLISGGRLRNNLIVKVRPDGSESVVDYWLDTYQHSSKHFYGRAHSAAEAYGLSRIADREGRVARALILLAAEYSVLPLIEGALSAASLARQTIRIDVLTGAAVLERWSAEVEPTLSRLAADAMLIGDESLPFPPFVRMFEHLLGGHMSVGDDTHVATELAVTSARELGLARSGQAPDAALGRQLVRRARELGVVPQPGAEEQEHLVRAGMPAEAITTRALLRIAIEFELGQVSAQRMHELAPIVAMLASQLQGVK